MMRKPMRSLFLVLLTAGIILTMVTNSRETITEARFARVERADVRKNIPIYGTLVYAEENIISAQAPGVASHVYVQTGDRVGEQAALIRMDTAYVEEALAVCSAVWGRMEVQPDLVNWDIPARVIRAENACTVREVYVEEGSLVAVGTPLLRISSHLQRVTCTAAPQDAEWITAGMLAWLSAEEEKLCLAAVESVSEATADPVTGMQVMTIVLIPEKEIELPEYAVIDADVYLAGSDDVLSLPIEAITQRDTVWWVCDERCTEIPAEIVLYDEMRAWVQLPEGMTVAIGEFQEGERVREVCQ